MKKTIVPGLHAPGSVPVLDSLCPPQALYGEKPPSKNRECVLYHIQTPVRFLSNRHDIRAGHIPEYIQQCFSRLLPG